MKKKRRKAVPNPARQKAAHSGVWKEYATAVAILLAGLVISVLILRRPPFLFHHVSDDGPVLTQKTADGGNPEGIPDSPTTYTVNFYDNDGIRIASRRVTGGDPILPPALTDEAAVFKGWSRPLYSIEEDMNVYPSFQFFDSAKNAVCADAVYADVKDEFAVTVRISGEVACCAFQIEASSKKSEEKARQKAPNVIH